jgi:hypothetical protein
VIAEVVVTGTADTIGNHPQADSSEEDEEASPGDGSRPRSLVTDADRYSELANCSCIETHGVAWTAISKRDATRGVWRGVAGTG